MQTNIVIQADCLEYMKTMPDKCVDLILTDPPYGLGEAAGANKSRGNIAIAKDYGNKSWDNDRPRKEYFDEMIRVSKNQIIFGGNYFADLLPPSPCWLVWDKDNGATDFADCELAWTSFSTAVRKFKWRWSGMLQEKGGKLKELRQHPTQKPLELMKWCLQNYSEEGMTILDPFAGSGTTGRACKDMNRNYILIEKEPDYVEIINKCLEQEVLL